MSETYIEMEVRHASERAELLKRLREVPEQVYNSYDKDIDLIARETAEKHGVSLVEMIGKSRVRHLCRARFDAWHIAQSRGKTLGQIGRYFQRDHTTILNGLKRHQDMKGQNQ